MRWDWAFPLGEENFLNETSFYAEVIFEAGGIDSTITNNIGTDTNTTFDLPEDNEYTFNVYSDCMRTPMSLANCTVNTFHRKSARKINKSTLFVVTVIKCTFLVSCSSLEGARKTLFILPKHHN